MLREKVGCDRRRGKTNLRLGRVEQKTAELLWIQTWPCQMLNLYVLLHPFSIASKCHWADPTMKYKQVYTKKTRRNSNAQSKSESILSRRQGRHACLIHHSHQAKFFRSHQAIFNTAIRLNNPQSDRLLRDIAHIAAIRKGPLCSAPHHDYFHMTRSMPCSSDTILHSLQV